jgi:hypothetical protein
LIRLMPLDECGASAAGVTADGSAGRSYVDPLAWAARRRYTASGRAALAAALESIGVEPADEVLITNSSGQRWISSCVTCTVFNYCQPSRVLTEHTRAILVIHEFGYPHPQLYELCALARERGVPLIEDCAHSLDSSLGDTPLGSLGQFAIFSLPKVLPVASGGVLVSAHAMPDLPDSAGAAAAEAAYAAYAPLLPEYSRRRRRNYEAIVRRFHDMPLLLEAGPGVTPSLVGLLTPDALDVRRRSSAIEWASTLRDDLLLVPTNPFVEPEVLVAALEDAFTPQEQV